MKKLFKILLVLSILGCALVSIPFAHVSASNYPILPDGVSYYESNFPSGLVYSDGWYGTMSNAPAGQTIYLFDDDNGICIYSLPTRNVPSGEQGGTKITPLSKDAAQKIINSYPESTYTTIVKATADIMTPTDCCVGTWGGSKLSQKYSIASSNTQVAETLLTPAQVKSLSDKQENIEKTFDPPRYFVLPAGNSNYNSTATWSSTSDGLGVPASVPTNADSVYPSSLITAGATLTVNVVANCLDMDWTGATNTPTFSNSGAGFPFSIYGNATFIPSMIVVAPTSSNYVLSLRGTGTHNITTNGLSISNRFIQQIYEAGTINFMDSVNNPSGQIYNAVGVLTTNNNAITTGSLYLYGTSVSNPGNSTITITQFFSQNTATINVNTTTINCSGNFSGGGINYNGAAIYLTGATSTITGNNTFSQLNGTSGTTQTITFTAGSTQTATSFSLSGTAGHLHTLRSSSAGNPWYLSDASGNVYANYVKLTDSNVAGGASYYYGDGTGTTADAYSIAHGWSQLSAPTVTISAATSVGSTTATLPGTLTCTYGSATVIEYWDTSDKGTGTWANTVNPAGQPQVAGAFSGSATGLPSGTTVYWSAYVSNAAGSAWVSASLNFLTIPSAPAGVSATDGTYTDKVTVTWTKSTGATAYKVLRGATNDSGTLGDVATYDDTAAGAPTITAGTATASDGTSSTTVSLSIAGQSGNDGSTESYTVYAYDATGWSSASSGDNGYRGASSLSYQWQRSDADSDSNYNTNLGTANTYNDTTAPNPTITAGAITASQGTSLTKITLNLAGQSGNDGDKRYYHCVLSMAGATNQTSVANEGYKGATSLTYQGQVSALDSDLNYSNIIGATMTPFDDTNPAPMGQKRFYRYELSAAGAATVYATAEEGWIYYLGAPANLTVTASGNNGVVFNWTSGLNATSTVLVSGSTNYPSSPTDGTVIYSGALTTFTQSSVDQNGEYISAWSYDGANYSVQYATTTGGGTMLLQAILLGVLALAAIAFTIAGYTKHQPTLGLLGALFFLLMGGFAATQTVTNWDIWYDLMFVGFLIGALIAMISFGMAGSERKATRAKAAAEKAEAARPRTPSETWTKEQQEANDLYHQTHLPRANRGSRK